MFRLSVGRGAEAEELKAELKTSGAQHILALDVNNEEVTMLAQLSLETPELKEKGEAVENEKEGFVTFTPQVTTSRQTGAVEGACPSKWQSMLRECMEKIQETGAEMKGSNKDFKSSQSRQGEPGGDGGDDSSDNSDIGANGGSRRSTSGRKSAKEASSWGASSTTPTPAQIREKFNGHRSSDIHSWFRVRPQPVVLKDRAGIHFLRPERRPRAY